MKIQNMKIQNHHYKLLLLIVALFVETISIKAQDENFSPLQNFQSPSLATFNTYGVIPVSLYTGTPDISIPLYTIKKDGVEIPIELKYNINNVKPNNHPGEVGLGWNLFAGGSITRIVQGSVPDEKTKKSYWDNTTDIGFIGHENILSDNWWDSNTCYSNFISNKSDLWYSLGRLNLETKFHKGIYSNDDYINDISPDKFIFNFLGYNGAFYRSHTGEWVIDSETTFKITHTIMTWADTRDQLLTTILKPQLSGYKTNNTLEKFILTAPNGIIFEFGGKNAIDYSVGLYDRLNFKNLPIATTWHLSRITLPNGKEFKFEYITPSSVFEGGYSFWIQSDFKSLHQGRNLSFQLIMPVLLNKIISPESENLIEFGYDTSIQLKYPTQYFANCDIVDISMGTFWDHTYNGNSTDDSWQKLTKMKIIDGTEYELLYTNSNLERLKLLSLTKKTTNKNSTIEYYNFAYNKKKLPNYLSGHYDHLGFYNGVDFSFTFEVPFFFHKWNITGVNAILNPTAIQEMENNATKFYNCRKGDSTGEFLRAEMLEKIQYPTGGYTSFEYEPHNIDSMVNLEKNKVISTTLHYPGGIRIKKITNYSDSNTFVNSTHYYYMKDFNPSTKTGKLSGILAFTPKYYWDTNLEDNEASTFCSSYYLKVFTSGSTNQAYYNLEGSAYVGYSEVVECIEDRNGNSEGYVKNKYTNFGSGCFDNLPLATLQSDKVNNNIYISPYTPFSSNSKKRGKLLVKDIYDKDNLLKHEINFSYSSTNYKYIRDLNLFVMPGESSNNYALGGSYIRNLYEYLLSKKTEKTVEGSDTIKIVTDYVYNNQNDVISEKKTFKDNDNYEVKTKYTGDFFSVNYGQSDTYNAIDQKYMYTLPVENVKLRNGKVISAEIKNYSSFTKDGQDVYYLSDLYNLETNTPLSDYLYASIQGNTVVFDSRCKRKASFSTFSLNTVPNYIETNSTKTVYLWSYNERYPIAEIKNATYQQVIDELGESYISSLAANPNPSDADLSKLNALRSSKTLQNIQLTTYTFKPFTGMNTKTDPRGITTYYKYNDSNQLESLKDLNSNILQQYRYHYSTQK